MKKYLVITLLFLGCANQSPQSRAEKSVKDFIISNADDPGSYESVSFEKIDSSFDFPESYYQALEYDIAQGRARLDSLEAGLKVSERYIKTAPEKEPPMEWKGYKIVHRYRAKNKMGALVLQAQVFRLDKNFKVIN